MPSVEAARGLAALFVVLMHAANLMRVDHLSGHVGLGGIFDFGYVGVDFFFVLSGFIISYVHHRDLGQPRQLPVYLWRRVVRIFPIYWFILALNVGTTVAGRLALGKSLSIEFAPIDIVGTLLLIPVAPAQFLGVSWSLQFEVMFYLLFAPLIVHRQFGMALLALWLALIGLRGVWPELPSVAGLLDVHGLQFLMGVAMGFAARQAWYPARTGSWLLGAVALFAAAVWIERSVMPEPRTDLGRLALGLGSAAILACLVGRERQPGRKPAAPAWLVSLGAASYSVYLGHITILNLFFMLLALSGVYHRLPEVVVYVAGVGVALTATMLISHWVEQPLIERLRTWVRGDGRASSIRFRPGREGQPTACSGGG